MDTKKKILDVALTLFSERGYGNVYVGQIAEGVGIKAPSLYKHYKSKQDIFNAILNEMQERYTKESSKLHISGDDVNVDAGVFSEVSEEELINMGIGLFLHFLHDDYERKFRKMLTIEQFSNADLALLFSKQYIDSPLLYQSGLFELIVANGKLRKEDTRIMALHFYSPIYMLLTLCDREPEREQEAIRMIENHIRQFNKIYKEEGK